MAKICGINDPTAMHTAVDAGASYIGLVFYEPSPRYVTPSQAGDLVAEVPDAVTRVGLFVNAEDAEIDAAHSAARLDLLQLHGKESPARVAALKNRTGLKVMKSIAVADEEDLARADDYLSVADMLLFDAKPPKDMVNALPGGNALSFEWRLLGGRFWSLPWMLAGGLKTDNVAEAVRLSGAAIVDTSSGVEQAPGKKDPEKIRAFLGALSAL